MAAAIEQAKSDLSGKTGENVENIIYVVSDGIETCGGDPVKAAKELHQSEIQAIVNIIGFDVDNAGQQALKKVAEAGGGKYTTVSTGEDLRKHLQEEYDRLREEWYIWGLDSSWDAQIQWGDKWEKLYNAEQAILDKYIRERERMLAAKDYLHSTGKLQNDDVESELDDKIWNRSNLISDYSKERYLKLSDLLRKARDNEQERVKKKAEEMEKNYER